MNEVREIRRRVLRIEQDPQHPLYLFGMTGAELLEIADISRVSRDDAGKLLGYQRAEVKKHVQNIVDYLNSGPVLFPNSIILALSSDVRFRGSRGPDVSDGCATAGMLEIPIREDGRKPAWIVSACQQFQKSTSGTHYGIASRSQHGPSTEVGTAKDSLCHLRLAQSG